MDERDLEARLAARLHARFDPAQPPARLVAAVGAGLAEPRPSLRSAFRRLMPVGGFAAILVGIVVIAVVGASFRPPAGASPSPASPSMAPTTQRHYIVLPPFGSIPTKLESSAAQEILSQRLRALGPNWSYSSAIGDAITFDLPSDADDTIVRAVLAATGDIEVVPLPPADYGTAPPVIGKPLPVDEPALFGWDGIAGASTGTDAQGNFGLTIVLKAGAASALATYTAASVGQELAILVDGRLALLPTIQGPITGGSIVVTPGAPGDPAFSLVAAVLQSAQLPDAWANPRVPVVIDSTQATGLALTASGSSEAPTAISAQLGTTGSAASSTGLRPVWQVVVGGSFTSLCGGASPSGATPGPCPVASTELVTLDAATGTLIGLAAPAP